MTTTQGGAKMKLILHHVKNVDLMYGQGNGSGYWDYPVDSGRKCAKAVTSLLDARKQLQDWITRNDLGCGNIPMDCGNVEIDGRVVAHISYNGAIWTPDEYPHAAEIIVQESAKAA